MRKAIALLVSLLLIPLAASAEDIVIHASEIPASNIHGRWTLVSDASAAAQFTLATADNGWSTTEAPLAAPTDYVDVTFSAEAGTPYTVWLRMRALNDSKWNDSVWVQYSDAVSGGQPVYTLNSRSALLVNLATDSTAGSVGAWGWQNTAYWLTQHTTVTFAESGTHTMRLQVREDGVQLDQIVFSSSTYLNAGPGRPTNDTTIVGKAAPAYVLTNSGSLETNAFGGPQLNRSGATILLYSAPSSNEARSYYASAAAGAIELGNLGEAYTVAHALNDRGVVVGWSMRSGGQQRAFVWDEENGIRDLAPQHPGSMEARSINTRGDIVGVMQGGPEGPTAFLYTGGKLHNLNALLVQNPEQVFLWSASLINEAGVIVGQGLIHGQYVTYLLTPR